MLFIRDLIIGDFVVCFRDIVRNGNIGFMDKWLGSRWMLVIRYRLVRFMYVRLNIIVEKVDNMRWFGLVVSRVILVVNIISMSVCVMGGLFWLVRFVIMVLFKLVIFILS